MRAVCRVHFSVTTIASIAVTLSDAQEFRMRIRTNPEHTLQERRMKKIKRKPVGPMSEIVHDPANDRAAEA
jgi:hypothetical protein